MTRQYLCDVDPGCPGHLWPFARCDPLHGTPPGVHEAPLQMSPEEWSFWLAQRAALFEELGGDGT